MATIASEAITAAMTSGLDVSDLEDRLINMVFMVSLLKWRRLRAITHASRKSIDLANRLSQISGNTRIAQAEL
jgi:hypothetical protein